ncbi:MAG: ABC transporter substrate-binding protein [Candidatus Kapaibacterium sp.]|nr:MAG: ABC transporter substrate-binding protein [Candidatus Kapabacteria bacterium]
MKIHCSFLASAVLLVLAAFAPISAQPNTPANTIKVGIMIGSGDPGTTTLLRSANMAIDEVNNAGGVLGKKLQLLPIFNSRRNYDTVPALTAQILARGAEVLISCGGSSTTMRATEVTIQKGVFTITPSSTSPKISRLQDNGLVWRTIPHDLFQGRIAADVLGKTKHRTVTVVHPDNAYGSELAKTFKELFEKQADKKVLNIVPYKEADRKNYDFKTLLDKIYDGKPEALYLIGADEISLMLTQSAQAGKITASYKPFLFGCDGEYNDDFIAGVETSLVEGMMGVTYIHPTNDKSFTRFIEEFQKRATFDDSVTVANSSLAALMSSEATNSYAASMYDAVYTMALAIAKAGSVKGSDIAKQMPEIANARKGAQTVRGGEFARGLQLIKQNVPINYDGVSGPIEFDQNGDVSSGNYLVWRIHDGKFVEEKVIAFP